MNSSNINSSNINSSNIISSNINSSKENRISYDDILEKMGMFVQDGKLHKGKKSEEITPVKKVHFQDIKEDKTNSIYCKKNIPEFQEPLTKTEYINLLLKRKIKDLQNQNKKSTKLIMPNENIQVSKKSTDVLFQFSHSKNL